ncbi:NtaA/DmoA family FMN-dependent monooxygenase [Vreelandella olivaria]|uniref:NtaA/DmoA family FMN-dependent monooxygenase n=1 Tax=Vreelandella olivaria TaxID=390919 RepID=UPI00201E8C69|nr:NtaA/DmoA family FMN-dependent monooxygenase [Halomonas olivaria]
MSRVPPTNRPLCIGLSLAITWLTGNSWRRTDSLIEAIHDPDFYTEFAQMAEQAHMDFLFRPDSLFVDPDVLAHAPGFSSLDPTLLMAALAQKTCRIGLVTTASTTFIPPYLLARQLQSLHHISHGRAGWNVVTALDGQQNFGIESMPSADERYARADECVNVVRQLWSGYPGSALLHDRRRGRYADRQQIATLDHHGHFFDIKGPLTLPSHPAGDVPLFQAGASDTGRDFAARIADAIFAATPSLAAALELRKDIQSRAMHHGRSASAVRVLPGLSLFLGDTREEAQELYQSSLSEHIESRQHAFLHQTLGIDVSTFAPAQRITQAMLPPLDHPVRSRTHSNLLRQLVARESPTVASLLKRPEASGSAHWQVVGTVEDALVAIEHWHAAGAIDGFIALPGGSIRSLELTCQALVPALAERGLFRNAYRGSTLRDHLGLAQAGK